MFGVFGGDTIVQVEGTFDYFITSHFICGWHNRFSSSTHIDQPSSKYSHFLLLLLAAMGLQPVKLRDYSREAIYFVLLLTYTNYMLGFDGNLRWPFVCEVVIRLHVVINTKTNWFYCSLYLTISVSR